MLVKYSESLLHKIFLLVFIFASSLQTFSQSQEIPGPMSPPRLLNDYAGFFNQQEQEQLEQELVAFNDSTSTQIAILTVKSLDGYEPNDFATRVIEKWGIGQKDKNNGILILIKPKTAEEKGEVYIGTGYGVESVVTDAQAQEIVDIDIIPNFKQGRYYEGINQAVHTLFSLTRGEFTADQYIAAHRKGKGKVPGIVVFLIIMGIILFIRSIKGGNNHISSGSNIPWWLLLTMNSGSRGSFGDFRSGSGGFGGFGGGGFGGFGGGIGGGGGAGGSW